MAAQGTVLDAFGRGIDPRPEPDSLRARTILDRVADRGRVAAILSDFTPQRIVAAFRQADEGYPAAQFELAMDLEERDGHLRSVLATRRLAPRTLEWIVEPGDESPEARRCADEFRRCWEALDTDAILERLGHAIFRQWAVERVIWNTAGSRLWRPVMTEEVDPRRLVWPATDEPSSQATAETVIPRVSIDFSPTHTEELTAGRYIVHSYCAVRGRPGRLALCRAAAFACMVKRMTWTDFGALVEQFGRPWIAVKHEANKTEEEVRAILRTIRECFADMCIGIPIGSELELKAGLSQGATAPHEALIRLCDESNSKLVLGNTTISDAANTGASESVSSPTHAQVRRDLRDADAKALSVTLRRWLAVPFALWNFGPDCPAPRIRPILQEKPDPERRGAVFRIAREIGLPVRAEQVYRELGIERPADAPELLFAAGSGFRDPGSGDGRPGPRGSDLGARTPDAAIGPTPALNGAQITAALEIMAKLRGKALAPVAARELLTGVGIDPDRARAMVEATPIGLDDEAGDVEFKRDMLKLMAANPEIATAIYNGTDMEDEIAQTGLSPEPGYEFPWIPVRDRTGALVSGDVIADPNGDVVGGAPLAGSAPTAAAATTPPPQGEGGGRSGGEGEPPPGTSDDAEVREGPAKGDAVRASLRTGAAGGPAVSAADDTRIQGWVDQASAAAQELAQRKFARVRAAIQAMLVAGATPAEVRDALPQIVARIDQGDTAELTAQVLMAGVLRGRAAALEAGHG